MRPRLTVATTFPVHPRLGGGQVRVDNLYRRLARWFEIEIVSLTGAGESPRRVRVAPGVWETVVPKSPDHDAKELAIERECGAVITDIAMAELYMFTPEYLSTLRDACAGSRFVVACHPYTIDAIREVSDVPLWYEAQDVEITLKTELLKDAPGAAELLATVARVEAACCAEAESIWTCSEQDRDELARRYNPEPGRTIVVANGADLDELRYVSGRQRKALRAGLRLGDRLLTIFVASWHHPNIVGVRDLVRAAQRTPQADFLIVGSAGLAVADAPAPPNVQILGPVSSALKQDVLSIADLALNPVRSGSGTNLKMLDYFGSGVPVVSTAFGARGLGLSAGEHYTCAEPVTLPQTLRRLGSEDRSVLDTQAEAARAFVEKNLSWDVIVDRLAAILGLGEGEPRDEAADEASGRRLSPSWTG